MSGDAWTAYVIEAPTPRLSMVTYRLLPALREYAEENPGGFNLSRYEGENPHLSVRVKEPDAHLAGTIAELETEGIIWGWETQPYTAPLEQRRGYELATRLWLALYDVVDQAAPDVALNDDLQLHMFHGLRNLLALEDPIDEALFFNRIASEKRREARQTRDLHEDETHE